MIQRKKSKVGRPREIGSTGRLVSVYMDSSKMQDFQALCDEMGVSISEGIRQLIEQELGKKRDRLEQPN